VTEEYNKEMVRITDELLELLSEGLGLEGKVLKSSLRDEEMEVEMKINMYPPCPQPQLALGVEPHTDMSALTLLVPNDVPGLQVSKDGNWVAVDYFPDALFVHVGDQIEVRTLDINLFSCWCQTN
jgi:flavonol synthase